MNSPGPDQRSGDVHRRTSFWSRLPLVWKGISAVVALTISVLTLWNLLPHPHATIANVTFLEHLTHEQYLDNIDFVDVADDAHANNSSFPPDTPGNVYYYTTDVFGEGFYPVRYELFDKDHNLLAEPVSVRVITAHGENVDNQAFWVPETPKAAIVHLIIAPSNPPPVYFDYKEVAWGGT